MLVPDDLRYTADHEWARLEGSPVRVGITDYAQDALGDVVFVQLPTVGAAVEAGTRSARSSRPSRCPTSTPRSPAGRRGERPSWPTHPQRLNEDPYGEGWICVIELADPSPFDGLLDADGVSGLIEQ